MALLNLRVGFHSPAVQRRPTVGRSSGVPTRARDVEAPVRANEVGRIKTNFFRRYEDYDPTALEGNSNNKLFQSEASCITVPLAATRWQLYSDSWKRNV